MSATAQYIVQASVTVIGIGLLAALLLLANRRWGGSRPSGPLTLLGQLPLGARRSVYLIEVGQTVYVLAATDHSLAKLGELERSSLPAQMPQASQSFAAVLQAALRRQDAGPTAAEEVESNAARPAQANSAPATAEESERSKSPGSEP